MRWVHFVVAMILLAACQTSTSGRFQVSAREQKIDAVTAQAGRKIQQETELLKLQKVTPCSILDGYNLRL